VSTVNQTDFENYRIALLNNYSAQATEHVTLIISLVVALAAIIFQLKFATFFTNNSKWRRIVIYYIPIALLLSAIFYCIYRIIYWASLSSIVLTIAPPAQSINVSAILWLQGQTISSFAKSQGLPGLLYSIDKVHFGFTLLTLFVVTFLYILCLDYFYDCRIKSRMYYGVSFGVSSIRGAYYAKRSRGMLVFIMILGFLFMLFLLFPHLVIPYLQRL
jgi:hypothetical protein